MTTPNRPPFPDWYQKGRRVPPHIGPTQRELIARRIRSLRKFLIGASFIGVASFTTLAAYHTESKTSTAAAETTTTTAVVQESAATTQATVPAQSLFNEEETKGFTAEAEHSDDGEEVAAAPAPAIATQPAVTSQATQPAATTAPAPQTASSSSQATAPQSTTAQVTVPQTSSRHRTKTVSS